MKYYRATFPSGAVEYRSTASRTYVACVHVSWIVDETHRFPGPTGFVTWAGRPDLADAQVLQQKRKGRSAEQAPAIEISASEYRRAKA